MIKTFKSWRVVSSLSLAALSAFSALPLFAETATPIQDVVSICSRTEAVRIAIQKEVATQRFTSGVGGDVRCNSIRAAELKKIFGLQIIEKEISHLQPGDFAGLTTLKTLDLEGNKLVGLDPAALADLTALENLVLARNPMTVIGGELSVIPNLVRVDYSGCKIDAIAADAFSGNAKLEAVFLPDNQLKNLPAGIFAHNDALRIIDLADNWLEQMPRDFVSDKGNLQSIDLSQNMIERIERTQIPKFVGLRVLNLAANPIEDIDEEGAYLQLFNPAVEVITSRSRPAKLAKSEIKESDAFEADSENPISQGVERVRSFVREHWHMPLAIHYAFSSPAQLEVRDPGLRAREARLLLRQLEEVREAYRRAAFDFFEVQIRFVFPESQEVAPSVTFDPKRLGFTITLKTPVGGLFAASLVTDDQILDVLAENFDRAHTIAWYKSEAPKELEAALKRDFEKLGKMDDELRRDIVRLGDLITAVTTRMDMADERALYSSSEMVDARFIQYRVMLAFQRIENTLARWKLAEADSEFAQRAEVRLLLSESAEIYRTYLDWFLETVVGGRATLNVLSKSFYHRNPIFKILDSEVPAGFFNLEGRISTGIPGGAVRDLLKSRLSFPLINLLHDLRGLDEKVSDLDIKDSALGIEMNQSMERIARDRKSRSVHKLTYMRALKELWDARIKDTVKFPVYRVMVGVASWIGDTRTSNPAPAITSDQIAEMKATLKPGDLLIERTDYFLSNMFLGGFWPHGIIYLGPKEEWSKMKLADGTTLAEDPWIADNILPNYHSEKDNNLPYVIESISEGAVFNSMEEAVQKDYIGVFRPKFAPQDQEAKVAAAIKRALKYHGRAYDFDFDFFTDDKLVCTELLYRAYHPDINFLVQKEAINKPTPRVPGMINKAGRDTMPAGEIARLAIYMMEHPEPNPSIGYGGQTLEFIKIYMKQGAGKPAQMFEGARGLEELKRTLQ